MSTPVEDFEKLLAEANNLGDLPLSLRTSEIVLQHRQFRERGRALLDFLKGHETEHQRLISLVGKLLAESMPPFPKSGSLPEWFSEIPHGKAPGFRRAREQLIKFLKK